MPFGRYSYANVDPYQNEQDIFGKYLAHFRRVGIDNPMLAAPVQQTLFSNTTTGARRISPYAIKGADNSRLYYKAYDQIRRNKLDENVSEYQKKLQQYGGKPDLKYLSEAAQAYVNPQKRRLGWGAQPKDTQAERVSSGLKRKLDSIESVNKQLQTATGTRRKALENQLSKLNSDVMNDANMVKTMTGIDYQDARIDKIRQDIQMAPKELDIKQQNADTNKARLDEAKGKNRWDRYIEAQRIKGKGDSAQTLKQIVESLPEEDRDLVNKYSNQIDRGVAPDVIIKQITAEANRRNNDRKQKEIDDSVKRKESAYERSQKSYNDLSELVSGLDADWSAINAEYDASDSEGKAKLKPKVEALRALIQTRREQLNSLADSAGNGALEFSNQDEALAAIEQMNIPPGTKIIIGGREVMVE